MMKTCSKCGIEKQLSEYNKDRTRSSDGHRRYCKKCEKAFKDAKKTSDHQLQNQNQISIMHDDTISIDDKIMTLPNRPPVMLDRDVAELYQVETRSINQAVERNLGRFPNDFYFVLTNQEVNILKSQFGTLDFGNRALPKAFTREGCNQLSACLNSKIAAERSVQIMRAFSRMESTTTMNANEVTLVTVQSILNNLQIVSDSCKELQSGILHNKSSLKHVADDVTGMKEDLTLIKKDVDSIKQKKRIAITQSTRMLQLTAIETYYNGFCPLCGIVKILTQSGVKIPYICHFDHFFNPAWSKINEVWPICKTCHGSLTTGEKGRTGNVWLMFQSFQYRVKSLTNNKELSLFSEFDNNSKTDET